MYPQGKKESIKGPSTGYREERERKRKGNLIIGKHEKIKLEKIFLCFVILELRAARFKQTNQTLVFQILNSAVQQINLYPVDKH